MLLTRGCLLNSSPQVFFNVLCSIVGAGKRRFGSSSFPVCFMSLSKAGDSELLWLSISKSFKYQAGGDSLRPAAAHLDKIVIQRLDTVSA